MTAEDFCAWMERHSLDYKSAPDVLGLGQAAIYNYANGSRTIPRIVELLCDAIDQGYRGFGE